MKLKRMLSAVLGVVLALALVAFAACGNGPETVAATGISLDKTTASVAVGGTVTITATVTPEDSTDAVTWASDDEDVATVKGGVVTGVAAGEATITAKAGDKTASCEVTVTPAPATDVAVTGITLDKEIASVKVDGTVTLTATVAPDNATDKTVTWASDDEDVATVADGVVTGVAIGEATITAKAGDKTATCTVTVTADAVVDTVDELYAAVENTENRTIAIQEGTYGLTKALFITRDVTIYGEGAVTLQKGEAAWTPDTSKGRASIVTITNGADVTLRGLTVKGAENLTMTAGTDYGHGVNAAQAGEVTLDGVTATGNAGVGIMVNDSVVTLKGVKTSDNGWGGVNIDVVGRNWTVPATVLTVDAECEFAEVAQIYCDDAAESAALEGKLSLPAAFNAVTVGDSIPNAAGMTIWTDQAGFTADTTIDMVTVGGASKVIAYATNGEAVTNMDTSGEFWKPDGAASGTKQVNGNFVIVYEWINERDENNTDVVFEIVDGAQFYDVQVGFPGPTGWGSPALSGQTTCYTVTLTKNGAAYTETYYPGMAADGTMTAAFDFTGDYSLVVVRDGNDLVVRVTFVQAETGDVYVYTYTYDHTNTLGENLTVQLVGNTYFIDDITVAVGAFVDAQA